jgi:transcriptional regulator with XRE-family HTH domain
MLVVSTEQLSQEVKSLRSKMDWTQEELARRSM